MTDPELFKALASNGPWAIMAGFLLWKVMTAWQGDRQQLTQLIGEFKTTLDGLKGAVERLAARMPDEK